MAYCEKLKKMILVCLFSCDKKRERAKAKAREIEEHVTIFEGSPQYKSVFPDIPAKTESCVLAKCFVSPYYWPYVAPNDASETQVEFWKHVKDSCDMAKSKHRTLEYLLLCRDHTNTFFCLNSEKSPKLDILRIYACAQDWAFHAYFQYVYSSPTMLCAGLGPKNLCVALDVSYVKYSEDQDWYKVKKTVDEFISELGQETERIEEYYQCHETRKLYFLGCFYEEPVVENKHVDAYFTKHAQKSGRLFKFVRVVRVDALNFVHPDEAESRCFEKIIKKF